MEATRSFFVAGFVSLAATLVWACTDATTQASIEPPVDEPLEADAGVDASSEDAGSVDEEDADSGITGACADTFGDALTAGFGRIDGRVYAVQKPSDTACTMPNSDHVIVQVLMKGAVYRLVTNVESNGADPDVRYASVAHSLPAPAFSEGWHEGVELDYVDTLGAHASDFAPVPMDTLVTKIADEVKIGSKISVYAESGSGRPESAHLIHRNEDHHDGAIVIDPTGSPKFLLFHFSDQTF